MYRPEHKEDDEEMVGIPEAFEVSTAGLLGGSDNHDHESREHDVARKAGSGCKVSQQECFDALVVLG